MICSECGAEAPALKTVYWREDPDEEEYALCDPCWLPVAGEVWIVPGLAHCFGTCHGCGEWFSVRELVDLAGVGKYDAPSGICQTCGKEG